jgi:hypothetical protein
MTRFRIRAALAAAALTAPSMVAGQDSVAASRPAAEFCFNGGSRSECGTFVIAEMQGVMRLAQTTRTVSWNDDMPASPVESYEDELQWEVGLMHNVSDRWALGGAARLGPGSTGALTGLSARARRWLSDDVAVDLSAGATFRALSAPGDYRERAGVVGDARLNFRDDAYVGLRYEQLPVQRGAGPYGGFDAGGEQRALSLLLGVGSEWAVAGSAALGLGLVLFLIDGNFE